jgi:beta-mannosidase
VRLEWIGTARVRVDQLVPLAELSPDLKNGTVLARLFVEGLTDQPVSGKLTAELLETGQKTVGDVEIHPGMHSCELSLQVPSPRLWWPAGHGEQSLYTLRVTLAVDDQVVGRKTATIGFRHVKVNQEVHPQIWRYFVFEINGKQIFCKGGNFVPADRPPLAVAD